MVTRHQEKLHRTIRAALISLTILVPLNHAACYDGYKVYRLYPDTEEKIALLKGFDGATGYDFWQEPRGNFSELMVAPEQQLDFEKSMDSARISTAIVTDDVGGKMRKDAKTRRNHRKRTGSASRRSSHIDWRDFEFNRYLRYDEILEYVKTLASAKSTAELFYFGETSQGRKMFGVKLSTSPLNPVVVIDGGIHAREWAAPMSVLYILRQIIMNDELIESVTIHIIPLVNPDGYEYTHVKNRLWRKTMSKQPGTNCIGVDANRNFDSHWNEFGAESDPCSDIYSGPMPFSEPESRAVRDLMKILRPTMYVTFHTYGGLILYPWGFTEELPQNWRELDYLGNKAAAEVEVLFESKYVVGSSTNVLYAASGGSDDWSMEKLGVPLVFCVELADFESQFELPPSQLNEVAQHADTILQVFLQHVQENYGN